ncbi:MAG: hypothetical protein AAB930_01070, partial [Patescibacteria group bacterium]
MAKKIAEKPKVKKILWKELGKDFFVSVKDKSVSEISDIIEKKFGIRPNAPSIAHAFERYGVKRVWEVRMPNPVWSDDMTDEVIYAFGVRSQAIPKSDRQNLTAAKDELMTALTVKSPNINWNKIWIKARSLSQNDIAKRATVNPKLRGIKAPLKWGSDIRKINNPVEQSPEDKILKRLQKGHWDIPGIAREFETSEEEAVRLIDGLYKKGHDIIHDRETKQVQLSSDLTKFDAFHFDPRSGA